MSLTLSMSSSAYAANNGVRGCSTTGAYGDYYYDNYHGPDATISIKMSLMDSLADGNSVRVRMLSKDVHGRWVFWPWHTNSSGNGTTKTWQTTASYRGGLFDIGIQVARMNPDGTVKNSCTDW
ncbi:hypothetical protein ACGF1Z_19300 [Streptomyces sp. NPDC048018]|uniref:hypothetical protein n=1 Tax=Streptomyces sp. NPDC048018 TaxID=3365499 RepID=UPI00371A000E